MTFKQEILKKIEQDNKLIGEDVIFLERNFDAGNVGKIDAILKDKDGNILVLEIVEQDVQDAVVNLLKKLVWAEENYSHGKGINGILITPRIDENIDMVIRASKFPISIKSFNHAP